MFVVVLHVHLWIHSPLVAETFLTGAHLNLSVMIDRKWQKKILKQRYLTCPENISKMFLLSRVCIKIKYC